MTRVLAALVVALAVTSPVRAHTSAKIAEPARLVVGHVLVKPQAPPEDQDAWVKALGDVAGHPLVLEREVVRGWLLLRDDASKDEDATLAVVRTLEKRPARPCPR